MYIYSYYAVDGTPLYVGSTRQVLQRFRQHQQDDAWMEKVVSITVRGPYSGSKVKKFEKMYISNLQPVYNAKSLDYCAKSDFRDDADVRSFSSETEFVEHFSKKHDTYERKTYHLRNVDAEAIRLLAFYTKNDKSAIVRDALKIGLDSIANSIGHENIYTEARRTICKAAENMN